MIPVVAALLEAGLGLLGNAVLAKGKEVVEDKLGVKLPDGNTPLEPAQVIELKRIEAAHEEWLIDAGIRSAELDLRADESAQIAVTDRWRVDMQSDSWLSKNIRPGTLAYLTVAITLMAFCSQWIKVDPLWIDLLKAAYLTVLGAYFLGRTIDKALPIFKGGKPT